MRGGHLTRLVVRQGGYPPFFYLPPPKKNKKKCCPSKGRKLFTAKFSHTVCEGVQKKKRQSLQVWVLTREVITRLILHLPLTGKMQNQPGSTPYLGIVTPGGGRQVTFHSEQKHSLTQIAKPVSHYPPPKVWGNQKWPFDFRKKKAQKFPWSLWRQFLAVPPPPRRGAYGPKVG